MHHNQPSKEPDYFGIMIIAFTLLFFTIFAMNLAHPVAAQTPDNAPQANIDQTWCVDEPIATEMTETQADQPAHKPPDMKLHRIIDAICGKIPAPAERLHITLQHEDAQTLEDFKRLEEVDARSLINDPLGRTHLQLYGVDQQDKPITRTIRPVVTLRIHALFARRDLRRGDVIHEADFMLDERQVSTWPREAQRELASVQGLSLDRPISAGAVLCAEHIDFPKLVRRGEQVNLRCVAGNLVIQTTATAMDEGGLNDMIEVRDQATRRRHLAQITDRLEVTVHANTPVITTAKPTNNEQR